jgi:hypothetical protein
MKPIAIMNFSTHAQISSNNFMERLNDLSETCAITFSGSDIHEK